MLAMLATTVDGNATWHPSVWWVVPFVVMLLCIAIIPLVNHHWWENNRNRGAISAVLALPVVILALVQSPTSLHHTVEEYVAFIVLLGALFTISGNILITGNLVGSAAVNTGFLAAGTLMASFVGTTGASMLLIRPLLTTNSERRYRTHTVIFFIFLVSNIGGCLTPLGDPPLFLGYLKGVPFEWTFTLWKEWALLSGILLVLYFLLDLWLHTRETPRAIKLDMEHDRPLVVRGVHNVLFLGGVVAAVALKMPFGSREAVMLAMVLLSWFTTRAKVRVANKFTFAPILEVVVVFAGIFGTMMPAVALLQSEGSSLGVSTPTHFFWATCLLSSFLDNAPTYVSFLSLANAEGLPYPPWVLDGGMMNFQVPGGTPYHVPVLILTAISLGAVFMGANTYIGNGPNFMVRAIAAEAGVKMPSFFGYLLWSGAILLPLFGVLTLVWFQAPV
jgi:Na+/H+ antiporter NhaD/arsenite permease-like protein